ncbi:uncharacterized protein LOC144881919 isoform X2 [Branchiostoma floridae x Branchiostoma japonicum]
MSGRHAAHLRTTHCRKNNELKMAGPASRHKLPSIFCFKSRPGVFTHFTAWFSQSVPEETVKAWLQQEGKLADQSCAKFLFSVEADCPDTREFFQSSLYLDDRLSMFHADFVDATVQQGDMSVVPIGMYVLPPPELHPELEKRGKLAWMKTTGCKETILPSNCRKDSEDIKEDSVTGENTVGQREALSSLADSERPLAADSSENVTAVSFTSTVVQATKSQDHREDIQQPTGFDERTSNEEVTEAQPKQGNNSKSASTSCSLEPEHSTKAHPDPGDSCRAPHRFLHSRLDDIPHVADLQMRSEVLQDFIPGSNGFNVKCRSK